jgi:hypothetical protein
LGHPLTDVEIEFVGGPLDGVVSCVLAMTTWQPPVRFTIDVITPGGAATATTTSRPALGRNARGRWPFEYAGIWSCYWYARRPFGGKWRGFRCAARKQRRGRGGPVLADQMAGRVARIGPSLVWSAGAGRYRTLIDGLLDDRTAATMPAA